ncbi:MAG: ABC transporter transmembrane domain-containing protein, partial [Alphaproteobacteria bacterium]
MAENRPERWTKTITRPLMRHAGDVVVLAAFVNVLALAAPVFTLQVYDRVIFFAGLTTLEGLVVGMALVLAFDFLLRQSRARILQRVALAIDVEASRRLFDKLLAVPLRTLETKPTIYWQTLFRDLEVVRNTFSGASALLIVDLPFALLFLAVIYVIATPIAWLFPVVLAAFLILSWRSGHVLSRRTAAENIASTGRDGLVAEVIAGRTTVKALDLSQPMRGLWEDKHAAAIRESIARGVHTDTYVNLGATLTVLTTVAITSVGALAIINQQMSLGSLIAANMLAGRIVAAFNQLFMSWKTYVMARQSIARLGEVFALGEERQASALDLPRPRGDLAVEDATFRYTEGLKPVLDAVSVRLPARGLHAIVGRNGSGKTTLLKLLAGLYPPQAGRVLL